MKKCLIVYFSQTGATQKVAERIATGLRTANYQVDLYNIKEKNPPDIMGYDLLGIGSPVYYYRPPFNVLDYVKKLPDAPELASFVFVLYGTFIGKCGNVLREMLMHKKTRDVGYFYCQGSDYYVGYLKEGYLFSPDHPTNDELTQAERFGQQVALRMNGENYKSQEYDQSIFEVAYRLERFLTSRFYVKLLYSRMFRVDSKKCDKCCSLCMELCPMKNIFKTENGKLIWKRNCLFCGTCELNCPTGAIKSPISWLIFRPFMKYNVHKASQDRSLDYVRVTCNSGKIKRM